MTLQEIIYNLKDSLGSDAEELTNRQYKFIIDYYRAKLLRQRLGRGEKLAPVFAPALHKIEIEKTSENDPGCADLDCDSYKTKKEIPNIIPYSLDATLLYLGSTDGFLSFQETTFQSLPFEVHAKYIKEQSKWYILGDKIYITTPPEEQIEYITIQGVFEDPLAAAALCDDFDTACLRNYAFEYPISGDMLDAIYKLIRDNELQGLIKEIDEDEVIAR
jgi:hypothetical protein